MSAPSQAVLIASSGRSPAGRADERVSDAERTAVADELSKHYTEGRLDQEEFDQRLNQAMAAKTYRDLAGLLQDLPQGDLPVVPAAPVRPRRRRTGLGKLILIVLIAIVLVSAAHAVTWMLGPVLWIALICAIAVLVARRRR